MSKDREPLSDSIGFRLPIPSYDKLAIVVSQNLDPRVRRTSDACRLGIDLYLEDSEQFIQRDDIRRLNKINKAIRETKILRSVMAAERELMDLVGETRSVDRAWERAEEQAKLILPGDYTDDK